MSAFDPLRTFAGLQKQGRGALGTHRFTFNGEHQCQDKASNSSPCQSRAICLLDNSDNDPAVFSEAGIRQLVLFALIEEHHPVEGNTLVTQVIID